MIDATAIYIYIYAQYHIYNKWIQMKPSHGFNPLLGIIEPWLKHRIQRLGGSPRSARATLTEALTDSYHGNIWKQLNKFTAAYPNNLLLINSGVGKCPILGILDITWKSSHKKDHIPNGWVMWKMGTWLMTHVIWLKSGSSCSCWCFMINPNYRAAGQRRAVGAIAGQGWGSELVTKKD